MSMRGALRRRILGGAIAGLAAAALMLGGSVSAVAEEPVPGTGSIRGVVTSETHGQPVEGVSVAAWSEDGSWASATTDAAGAYVLEGLAPSDYKVEFTEPPAPLVGEFYNGVHWSWEAQLIPVGAGEDVTGIDASLELGGSIAGRVTRDSDGAPVQSGIVQVSGSSGGHGSAFTDANGEYVISGLMPGEYRVEFLGDSGLAGEYFDGARSWVDAQLVVVNPGETTSGIDAGLAQGGSISGIVTREGDGSPVEGAYVHVVDQSGSAYSSAVTDEGGFYRVDSLVAGEYTVTFRPGVDDGLAVEYWDGVHSAGQATSVAVAPGEDSSGIDASLVEAATISGTVTRGSDGSPVEASVTVGGEYTTTDEHGNYSVRVAPGEYTVHFQPFDQSLLAEYWQDARAEADATRFSAGIGAQVTGIDAQLTSAAQITGTVSTGGVEIFEGSVSAWSGDEFGGMAWLNEDGTYTMYVAPGTYTIEAYATAREGALVTEYYESAVRRADATPITLAGDQTISGIDFTLERGADIRGALSAEGVAGGEVQAHVTAYRWSGEEWQAIQSILTGAGDYSFSGSFEDVQAGRLPAGTYTIGVQAEGFCDLYYGGATSLADAETFELSAGQTYSGIDVELSRECPSPGVSAGVPVIVGEPRMGQVLTVLPGDWGPSGVELHYQWLADGEPIPGAQSDILQVTGRLRGARISVVVTGTLAGHIPAEAASAVLAPVYAGPKRDVPVG